MQRPTERSGICLDRERRREFGGIGRELVDRWGRLGTNNIGGIERVIGIRLTFTGEGMEGDRLVSDIVHRKRRKGGARRRVRRTDGRAKGERDGVYNAVKHMGCCITIIYLNYIFLSNFYYYSERKSRSPRLSLPLCGAARRTLPFAFPTTLRPGLFYFLYSPYPFPIYDRA